MTVTRALLTLLFSVAVASMAQTPTTPPSSELFLRIKKLKVLGAALYIAAHPDDENTRLITWFSNDQLMRSGYLSLTRGDGGQNLIGDEQGVELGLIRTQELLAARRIDGGEQFFSRAFDFGYSKSTEEALRIWGKDKILSDVVWIIRRFQPDVIVTRFPPDNRAGHGHHSASAVLAREAFTAAADKNAFPGQFKYGVVPWQAKRLVWNAYNFTASTQADSDKIHLDAGGFNALLGKSYGEIAAESRSQHKSQGFGIAPNRGRVIENFSHTAGIEAKQSLIEGIDMTWERVGAPAIRREIDSILHNYELANPAASVPALVRLYDHIDALNEGYWKTVKLRELQEIIAAASGLWLDVYTNRPTVAQSASLPVTFAMNNRQGVGARMQNVHVDAFDTAFSAALPKNETITFSTVLAVPGDKPVTQPYWLDEKMSDGSYNVPDQRLIGTPDAAPAFTATFTVRIEGRSLVFTRPLRYRHTDPVKGEIYEPLVVVPSPARASQYGRLRHIHYDHIPEIYYFQTDTQQIRLSDVKIVGKKIGYIEGAGDKVPAALALMGYDVTILKEKDITAAYLSQFDAVITGVRAYNVRSYLQDKNDVFTEYVRNGGNFIVQYNVNRYEGEIGPIGPLAFTVSDQRITDEHAPVRFVLPNHPVLNFPNRITEKDFEGWKQERAIYTAQHLDKAFETPLAMKDPGEDEQNGTLAIAHVGKGTFVYTGLVFFRELPAGINGAYRLLANIIALNHAPK